MNPLGMYEKFRVDWKNVNNRYENKFLLRHKYRGGILLVFKSLEEQEAQYTVRPLVTEYTCPP